MVLIRPDIVEELGLPILALKEPETVDVAISFSKTGIERKKHSLVHYVKLRAFSSDSVFQSHVVHAVICPGLCMPIIFGLPFLEINDIICDHKNRTCIVRDKNINYNLLQPIERQEPPPPKLKLRDQILRNKKFKRDTLHELLEVFPKKWNDLFLPNAYIPQTPNFIATILHRIKTLEFLSSMENLETNIRKTFSKVFEPIPHVNDLPMQPLARITLKDASKMITTRNYPSPRKWKDAWYVLLQQHLDAGRIRPSHAPTGSGAFIIPKADPTVLPRWVNDYRQLNANTVTDCFPIPRIDDILADCAKGKIWATIDMTNSFFQTRMHPDDVPLTAVNTPWGLYEWLVMPMGIKNAPSIHQRRVTAALRQHIGKICHIYLDDIVIWSENLEEHVRNVRTILQALEDAKLYCNPKKTRLFCSEILFLGHRISTKGIEPDEGKADHIKTWPTPSSSSDVRSFLGLVRYLAAFFPKLVKFTVILDELTRKECDKHFPGWKERHQVAFESIKKLVTSTDCLTTIDPRLMPEYKIFVTTDASDTGSGAILSFGPSYKLARPVAYDSRSFKGAELNYPVHEKELLAIIRALGKWRTDLLGYRFEIWTDHKTLIHFENQKDLSRRQARWMEFLAQYDASINYIPGENNCVADALSRLPESTPQNVASLFSSSRNGTTSSTINLDINLLNAIKTGYPSDPFVAKLTSASAGLDSITKRDDFWFINDRLVIPNVKHVRETLYRLAHDCMGHFGAGKCLSSLRDSFYWPNMRRDL
jgi:RNase H-like domain found in reverse transcriptase/Reverse transcriptase (RNA-dependent DNA polymerase)/Integrase zinc binding domain